jgi:hypothetical protein
MPLEQKTSGFFPYAAGLGPELSLLTMSDTLDSRSKIEAKKSASAPDSRTGQRILRSRVKTVSDAVAGPIGEWNVVANEAPLTTNLVERT